MPAASWLVDVLKLTPIAAFAVLLLPHLTGLVFYGLFLWRAVPGWEFSYEAFGVKLRCGPLDTPDEEPGAAPGR
ncbi:hypothetical protein [Amycolatopsis sp. 195334CR]|uniref:hypothetical protein n=1 Tax=Amycolatopsis sp. 195334CR TaxID=2814588 RepID=UPI001A8C415C|nr:hypothetical protein [Amycolatopsis sp. 195334CR]MBN6041798.1 hypothetical protein [Amycolatopsis sp. 195334CR]